MDRSHAKYHESTPVVWKVQLPLGNRIYWKFDPRRKLYPDASTEVYVYRLPRISKFYRSLNFIKIRFHFARELSASKQDGRGGYTRKWLLISSNEVAVSPKQNDENCKINSALARQARNEVTISGLIATACYSFHVATDWHMRRQCAHSREECCPIDTPVSMGIRAMPRRE